MNRADNNLTPSDLIYLFVDGEASDLERTMLFNSLVGNAELQGELADAIRINSAAQGEMFETLPPAAVTQALFRRVESLAASRSIPPSAVGVAGAAALGLEADRPPVASTAETGERRRAYPFLAPILTGALGLLLGFVLFQGEGSDPGLQKAERMVASAAHERGDQIHTSEVPSPVEVPAPIVKTESEKRAATHARSGGRSIVDERRMEVPDGAGSNSGLRDLAASNTISVEPSDGSGLEDLAVTNPRTPLVDYQVGLDQESYLSDEIVRPLTTDGSDDVDQLSFFVRGGPRGGIYPERSATESEGVRENLENLAVGGYWHLDDNHAIGLQGGRDFHPFYREGTGEVSTMVDVGGDGPTNNQPVILSHVGGGGIGGNPVIGHGGDAETVESTNFTNNNQGNLLTPSNANPNSSRGNSTDNGVPVSVLDPTIEWIGVGYRLRGPRFDRLGQIRPEVQATLGVSPVGPVGRTLLGLSWQPGTHVSLLAGVEGTGVMYRRSGETYTSRKIGLVYGVEVGF